MCRMWGQNANTKHGTSTNVTTQHTLNATTSLMDDADRELS